MPALYDKPRPGQKPKITGDIEAQLVVLVCSDAPEGHDRWTLRLLAERLVELTELESISHVAVGERLKNELKPWRVKSWCISAGLQRDSWPRWKTFWMSTSDLMTHSSR